MYGLKPTDIDSLVHLRNAKVTQICVGTNDIQFNFHPRGNVSVQGRCELIDSTGKIIQIWERATESGTFQFPDILMTTVVDVTIDSPKSFLLRFESGMALRVVDDSDQYESFSVGNLYV